MVGAAEEMIGDCGCRLRGGGLQGMGCLVRRT